ncbi:OmpA family protein [Puia sp. P3]|uniref:OmpA family protein n=1 Tax=Puia sp. P3 TaxID=3423952 RepID=UPI003D666F6D
MKKVMICLVGCFLMALTTLRAQGPAVSDTTRAAEDSVLSLVDTAAQMPAGSVGQATGGSAGQATGGSVISRDTVAAPAVKDTTAAAPVAKAPAGKVTKVVTVGNDAKVTITPTDGDTKVTISTPGKDTTIQVRDSTVQVKDTVISLAGDPAPKQDTVMYASSKKDNADADVKPVEPKDTATKEDKEEENTRKLDTRWFISPLLKAQFQDFALLEKNRKGYLSDANTLPFLQRGNGSFAASAYKNLTQRLSVSADIGLSFGHVTNDNVLISQTKSKTYNLLNAALYYHLLAPSYRLQPYVTVGINDVINDASYASVPMGIGAKFNARKVMVTGQVMYGYAISKAISNTTMYSIGIYLPIKNKKQKQLDQDDKSPYNRKGKEEKKDSTGKGGVVNNIYITINMDSVLKSKGLLDENGKPIRGGDDGDDDGAGGRGGRGRRNKAFRNLGLDDFDEGDYRIDSLDGKPVLRFVVYFEFNEYGLTSRAFGAIDKVISHLKRSSNEFNVEIKGYTDSVGSNSFNNVLSRRRAKMVLDYMNSRGYRPSLMKAKAYGSDNPVADNSDPNQAWLNRRAEIIVHQKEGIAAVGEK